MGPFLIPLFSSRVPRRILNLLSDTIFCIIGKAYLCSLNVIKIYYWPFRSEVLKLVDVFCKYPFLSLSTDLLHKISNPTFRPVSIRYLSSCVGSAALDAHNEYRKFHLTLKVNTFNESQSIIGISVM
jgi:hypothetical protein